MSQKRQAFLIIAHNHWEQLKKLVTLLDHERVDFYLHIDKKSTYPTPDPVAPLIRRGRLFYVPRLSVNWGAVSQIRCEFELIRAALKREYSYCHLISGVDLPLKPIDEILAFFDQNEGKEFVHFDSPGLSFELYERFSLYYLFQEMARSHRFFDWAQWKFIALQKHLGFDRLKGKRDGFYKGANWFSCTTDYLSLLLKDEKTILKQYRFSRCCDEIFLQTHLMHTPFCDRLFDPSFSDSCLSNMRFIDWERGEPYTFRDSDTEELLSSPYLFARKFNEDSDPKVIDDIFHALKR